LKQAGVLAGLRSSNIVVVDQARPAAKPAYPSYPLNLVLSAAFGLTAGMGLALMTDALDKTMHTPQDLNRMVGLQPLGVLPRFAKAAVASKEEGERVRALRTSLHLNGALPPKVIVVSSALAGEGKTPLLVAIDGRAAGVIAVADTLKEDSVAAVAALRKLGLDWRFSGDYLVARY